MRVEIFLHLWRTWQTYHEQQGRITFPWQPEVIKPCRCLQKGTYGFFHSVWGRFITQENAGRQMGTILFLSQPHKWKRVQIGASNRELSPGAPWLPSRCTISPVLASPAAQQRSGLAEAVSGVFQTGFCPKLPLWRLCQTSSALHCSIQSLNPGNSCWWDKDVLEEFSLFWCLQIN